MMSDKMIGKLAAKGFNRWTKGNIDRMYINASQLGLACSYHTTGSIKNATFCGVGISNCEARRLKADKCYIDLKTGAITANSSRLKDAAQALIDEAAAEIEAEEAAAKAEEEKKEEEPMNADTYDTLRSAINERNDELIPYIGDSAASAVLEETARIWDSGESLSTEYPNAFFPEKRKDDSPKEWAAAVQYAVNKLGKLARKQFAAGLSREQAIAICTAIAPHGTVTVAGVSHDMDSLKDTWNAAHPEAQQIQYMGMGER